MRFPWPFVDPRHALHLKLAVGIKEVILELYRDNGKEDGDYYLGFRKAKGTVSAPSLERRADSV